MSNTYDFTLHALDRRLKIALDGENWAAARVLTTVLGMYTKDIIRVQWENGEPVFHLTKKGSSIADDVSSALEKIDREEHENEA